MTTAPIFLNQSPKTADGVSQSLSTSPYHGCDADLAGQEPSIKKRRCQVGGIKVSNTYTAAMPWEGGVGEQWPNRPILAGLAPGQIRDPAMNFCE